MCVHTLTLRENRVRNILKSSEKTQYLMNTLYLSSSFPLFGGVLRRDQSCQDTSTSIYPILTIYLLAWSLVGHVLRRDQPAGHGRLRDPARHILPQADGRAQRLLQDKVVLVCVYTGVFVYVLFKDHV